MTKLVEWTVQLSDRDSSVEEFLRGTQATVDLAKRIQTLRAQLVPNRDYASHQGSTVTPRPFWVVRVQTATRQTPRGAEETVPLLDNHIAQVRSSERASRVQGQGKRKQAWRGAVIEGKVPTKYLFGLLTSRHVGSFSILHRELCVVPAVASNGRLNVLHHLAARAGAQRTLQNEDEDEKLVRAWVQTAQSRWKRARRADQQELCTQRFDYNGSLASQPVNSVRVVHTRSGKFYAALLRPDAETSTGLSLDHLDVRFRRNGRAISSSASKLGGVIVDNLLHWIEVPSVEEGYWLVGVLNSEPFVALLEKEVQNRDFYSAPSRLLQSFNLRFDSSNTTHASIAARARLIESIKSTFDRTVLEAELGVAPFSSIDDTTESPEVPRIRWSFDELRGDNKECRTAFSAINSLSAKILR